MVDPKKDAQRVFEVLKKGGIAIVPTTVGYGIVATNPDALDRIFATKQRQQHKRHAMIGSYTLHCDLHVLPEREKNMVKLLTVDLDLPLGVVAPFRPDHPIIQRFPPHTLSQSSIDGTMAMLINGGALQDELSRLATSDGLPLMGSSANLTGRGTKVVVEEIEPEIQAVTDITIDYGRQKFQYPRPSSTMFDFKNMKLLRYGACYDVVRDAFWRFYGIDLPYDPGQDVLLSGHLNAVQNEYHASKKRGGSQHLDCRPMSAN